MKRYQRGFLGLVGAQLYAAVGVASVVAVTALLATTYHLGGNAPRAKLAELNAEISAASAMQKADNARRDLESARQLSAEKERHDKELRDSNARWNSRLVQLQAGSRSSGTAAAVQVGAGLCSDPARDQRFSDAIQRFASEVAGLLAVAEKQAIDYSATVGWVNGERAVEGR